MNESQTQIIDRLKYLVKIERKITREILDLINRAQSEKVYLELGFSSMFAWLTEGLGYSNPSAQRRIDAARMLKAVPEARAKIETGELNITTVSSLGVAIRREEKRINKRIDVETKKELLQSIESKSSEDATRVIVQNFPEIVKTQERIKQVANDCHKIELTANDCQMAKLKRVRELTSHSNFGAGWMEIVEKIADEFLERHDPLLKEEKQKAAASAKRRSNTDTAPAPTPTQSKTEVATSRKPRPVSRRADTSAAEVRSRYISAPSRRAVMKRDGARCTFREPKTGRICGSRFQIEVDHIRPFALGGISAPENLRCLCRAHNQHRAQQTFGI